MFHKIPVFAVVKVVTRNVRPASIAVASINRYSGQSLYRQFSEAAGKAPANAASQNNESAEAAVEAKVVDPLVQLQQQNAALQEEVKTLKDKLLRSYAEEENVRRIALKDVNAAKDYANTKFAKSLLDVADNLERAIGSIEQEQRTSADPHFLNLLQGVEMTQKGLTKVFESHGIVKVRISLL